jgi:hypothetical protein
MPSFDVVSEVDMHQLTNAVDQAGRIVGNRFDFKGIDAGFELVDKVISIHAEADFQLQQLVDMLRTSLIKCQIDPLAMQVGDASPSGKRVLQMITMQHGLDRELAKKIVKQVKGGKLKLQATIQDEQVRITGKKRDELQQLMAQLRTADFDQPLQFVNFRD